MTTESPTTAEQDIALAADQWAPIVWPTLSRVNPVDRADAIFHAICDHTGRDEFDADEWKYWHLVAAEIDRRMGSA